METNVPKRRDNKKSLRVKVISLGNAEVGKVSENHPLFAVYIMPVRFIILDCWFWSKTVNIVISHER